MSQGEGKVKVGLSEATCNNHNGAIQPKGPLLHLARDPKREVPSVRDLKHRNPSQLVSAEKNASVEKKKDETETEAR